MKISRGMCVVIGGLCTGIVWLVLTGQNMLRLNHVPRRIAGVQNSFAMDAPDHRLELLRTRCRWPLLGLVTDLAGNKLKTSSRILVDKHHRLSYCNVPKVGSSFWYSAFALLGDDTGRVRSPYALWDKYGDDLQFKVNVTLFKQLPSRTRDRWLQSSQLFLFVRDPYARLFSAYVDKFVNANSYYWLAAGKAIVRYARSRPSLPASRCGHDVSFEEFLRFFVATEAGEIKSQSDHHWTPIYKLCSPCRLQYDFIGKTETFLNDTIHLIKSAKLDDRIDFQRSGVTALEADINGTVTKFLQHSLKLRTCVNVKRDVWRLWYTFAAKGYIRPGTEAPKLTESLSPLNMNALQQKLSQQALDIYKQQSSPGSRTLYRKQFLTKAFNDIPEGLLLKVRKILLPDLLLFGYDPQPKNIFSDQTFFDETGH